LPSYLSRATRSWAGRGVTCPNLPWSCVKRTAVTCPYMLSLRRSPSDLARVATDLPRVVTCPGLPVTYPEVTRLAFDLARGWHDFSGPAKTCIMPVSTSLEVARTWLGPTWPSQDMLCAAHTYSYTRPERPRTCPDQRGVDSQLSMFVIRHALLVSGSRSSESFETHSRLRMSSQSCLGLLGQSLSLEAQGIGSQKLWCRYRSWSSRSRESWDPLIVSSRTSWPKSRSRSSGSQSPKL